MNIHFEAPHITIGFDETVGAVVLQWKQLSVGSEEFRSALNTGLNILTEQGSQHWLADVRHLGFIPVNDQDWTNHDWYPRAVQMGIRKMALVLHPKAMSHSSTNHIFRRVSNITIEIMMFDNETDAKQWLAKNNTE
jgi:hypothetical protein